MSGMSSLGSTDPKGRTGFQTAAGAAIARQHVAQTAKTRLFAVQARTRSSPFPIPNLCATSASKARVTSGQSIRLDEDTRDLFCHRWKTMFLQSLPVPVVTIGLLICSNVFMTFAWYGHLRFKAMPLLVAVLVSWGIAFFEYMLQVPANRVGYGTFSAAELKAIQEIISLTVFAFFSTLFLGESLRWNHIAGFALIVAAAFLIFKKW